MAAEERARLEAAERAAATRVQAASRAKAKRKRYAAMRAAALVLQAHSRRYAVQVLVLELLRDLRMLRNGHVFIKFSQVNGRPHDRLVQLQGAMTLKWSDPLGGPSEGGGDIGIALTDIKSVSGALNFSLLKKIVDAIKGFEGKSSGIKGHFALRTKCCFTVSGPKRSLDVQAQSEWLKEEWVSALKLLAAYTKQGSLTAHAERAKLADALETRRFVRQAVASRQRKNQKRAGFLSFAPKRLQEWG